MLINFSLNSGQECHETTIVHQNNSNQNSIITNSTMDSTTNLNAARSNEQHFQEIISDVVESLASDRAAHTLTYDMYQQQQTQQTQQIKQHEQQKVAENLIANNNNSPTKVALTSSQQRNLIARKKLKRKQNCAPPAQIPSSDPNKTKHRTYFRAPGLEAPTESFANSVNLHVCPICSFSCSSIFHYNSHMNTHGYHKCLMCNYTARTEGRLKKHMKTSHSRADRIAVGLDKYTDEELAKKTENKDPLQQQQQNAQQQHQDNKIISTTMASIVAMVNQVAATNAVSDSSPNNLNCNNILNGSNGNAELLRLVDDLAQANQYNANATQQSASTSTNLSNLLEQFASKNSLLPTSALESIRALTERTNSILGCNNVQQQQSNMGFTSALSDILAMGNPQEGNKEIDDLETAEIESIVCSFSFI